MEEKQMNKERSNTRLERYIKSLLASPGPTMMREGRGYALRGSTNFFLGTKGGNTIRGSDGNDLIDGGRGDDTLSLSAGRDIFVFRRGDGVDTIKGHLPPEDYAYFKRAVYFADRYRDEVHLEKDGNDLLVLSGTDQVRIVDQFSGDKNFTHGVTSLWFANGRGLLAKNFWRAIENHIGPESLEAEGGIILNAGSDVEYLYGSSESDTLQGTCGDDLLDGLEGNDALYGGDGNDILYGGEGNDILYGGSGNDTYVITTVDEGSDSITDTADGYNVVHFQHVHSNQVTRFARQGDDLHLEYGEGDLKNQLLIKHQFAGEAPVISTFRFADSVTMTRPDFLAFYADPNYVLTM